MRGTYDFTLYVAVQGTQILIFYIFKQYLVPPKGLFHLLVFANERNVVRFSGSHGGEYEAQKLLGCTAVF